MRHTECDFFTSFEDKSSWYRIAKGHILTCKLDINIHNLNAISFLDLEMGLITRSLNGGFTTNFQMMSLYIFGGKTHKMMQDFYRWDIWLANGTCSIIYVIIDCFTFFLFLSATFLSLSKEVSKNGHIIVGSCHQSVWWWGVWRLPSLVLRLAAL